MSARNLGTIPTTLRPTSGLSRSVAASDPIRAARTSENQTVPSGASARTGHRVANPQSPPARISWRLTL